MSRMYQRGQVPPTVDDYIKEQYEFCKRDGECAYNQKAVERALKLCAIVSSMDKLAASSILDVGCRDGFSIATFEDRLEGTRVVGIDIVPEFVANAKKVANEVYLMDAHKLDFKDNEFDYVFSSHTLEHCHTPMQALSEMKRVALKGLYLALPLEPTWSTEANHSHYVSTIDPLVWANMVSDENWLVTGVEVSAFSDIELTAMRRADMLAAYKEATSPEQKREICNELSRSNRFRRSV